MFTFNEAMMIAKAHRILKDKADANRHSTERHVGYFAGVAEQAADSLFDVLNVGLSYLDDEAAGTALGSVLASRDAAPAASTSEGA